MSGSGFFSDLKLQAFAISLVGKVSSFVETGACEGDTTRWAADRFESVYTCEIDPKYMKLLWDLPRNVQLNGDSSEKFLYTIRRTVGALPLIFLDAHWFDYWPLLDELKVIEAHYQRAVIIVHDCAVPGRPNFWACRGGGADHDGMILDWSYISQAIDVRRYRLFYPTYTAETPGYCVLFKDCEPMGDLADLEETQT